jgi:GMP synthase (glutamine-hydrolysing)
LDGLKFLVVDGNPVERRAVHERDFGKSPGNAYGDTLLSLAPAGSLYDICFPADPGANLPQGSALADYDGVALTGSSLHLWNREPAVERQISLAREIFRSRTAFFGSCWGVQMACVAAGGDVQKNPLGREFGFARNIAPTSAGRTHPLLAGRPDAFDAPAIHLDIISTVSPDMTALASNALSPVQATEIRHEGGIFWGVQYHPEFSLTETASIIARLADGMAQEGFFRSGADGEAYARDLVTLDDDPSRTDIAWRFGLNSEVLDPHKRTTEIRNWINHQVLPMRSQRSRG